MAVLRGFDKKNGAVLWEFKMAEPPYGTPMR